MENEISPKKRNPFIAALLSLITPGLGQVYNGQLKKGLILYLLALILPFLCSVSSLQYRLYGLVLMLAVGILYHIFIIGDAVWIAFKSKEFILKPYNKGYLYLVILVLTLIIASVNSELFIGGIGVKAYKMPSGSMEPTLEVGDRFIVDLKYYKTNKMKHGDVIVFESPKDPPKMIVKRIVGLPGDVVEIRDKALFLNGDSCSEPYTSHLDPYVLPLTVIPRDNFGPDTIPENKLFVLGDNRDNSNDSRFFGNVEIQAVKGKTLYLYWPLKKGRWGKKI